jgi:anti-sigma B factor antagonist
MSLRNRLNPYAGAHGPGPRGPDVAARFQVDAQPEPWGVHVCPIGEIDLATVDNIRRKIDECAAAGCERLVLDLRGVTFMDSTGLHLVLETHAAAREEGWELLVVEGPDSVQRVFEVTGLRDRLPFVDAPPSLTPNPRPA